VPALSGKTGQEGRHGVRNAKEGIKKVELKTAGLLNGGEYVNERGVYEMGDGTKRIDKGKYMVIWN
jgi:hypothetical protein